ncbi:MAG: hypothetical protein B7X53_07225 [Hyphomonas sp. 34-62-18]|nr:DUF2793 domain-containing protein [Hyphomonas sp. 34-62-18]OZB17104.1 MAG: hypothetical protein B7X53_07225 [Hyphomonas sp. 34-62-18]
MDHTSRLGLPFLLPNQSQKHVTLNDALGRLDVLVQLSVLGRGLSVPPAEPSEGACWIVGPGGSESWAGHDDEIAVWADGVWQFHEARPGWVAFVLDEGRLIAWGGASWGEALPLQNISQLGIGTVADSDNPFSAKLGKALWTARYAEEGGDGNLRYTLNKETADSTLSLLMQSDWSGRAEIGLIGNDDLSIKVSADGAGWTQALSIKRDDGQVTLPSGMRHGPTGLPMASYIPAPVKDIWRLDASRSATPRSYAISAAGGTVLTLSTAQVSEIFSEGMRGKVAVRVWNTSKSPAESAWVDWDISSTQLRVTDASHIASWGAGDLLQLGDPAGTGTNMLGMVALDVSPYLANELGAVFPQKGLMLALYVSSVGGSGILGVSASGDYGSVLAGNALQDGTRNHIAIPVPTNVPSPISGSNLLFLREQLESPATAMLTTFVRLLGVYA